MSESSERASSVGEKRVRGRVWMGTIWDERDLEFVRQTAEHRAKYSVISDQDHTEEGQLHWHVLLQFKNAVARPKTKTGHWERPKSITGAREYCLSKGPNHEERGQIEIDTKSPEQWEAFKEACKVQTRAELIDGPFSRMYARFPKFAHEVHNTFAELSILDGELQNEWIWGEPGVGKTRGVWEKYGYKNVYVKSLNKWWDGYEDKEVVLLDDWDPTLKFMAFLLKSWADRYPFRAETKGGSMMIRPKKLVVTSNYSIEQCFEGEDVDAMKRRFRVVHMSRAVDYQ